MTVLPIPKETIKAMLKRENEIRLSEHTQALYANAETQANTDWMDITEELQRTVVKEFGFDKDENAINNAVHTLRCAQVLFAYDPEITQLALYIKYNRARSGDLEPGSIAPNLTLMNPHTSQFVQLLDFAKEFRPLVLISGSVT